MSFEFPKMEPDPRDPGAPLTYKYIDNTTLQLIMHCPRHYFYSAVLGLRRGGPAGPVPTEDTGNVHLIFGALIHDGADIYCKLTAAGVPAEEATLQAVKFVLAASWPEGQERDVFGGFYAPVSQCTDRTKTISRKGIKRCELSYTEHMGAPTDDKCPKCERQVESRIAYHCTEKYKNRRSLLRAMVALCDFMTASDSKVITAEDGRVASEMRWFRPLTIATTDGTPVLVTGSFDSVAGDPIGRRLVREYKTTKRQPDEKFWTSYQMSPQVYTYTWGGVGEFGPGTKVQIIAMHIGVGFVEVYAKEVYLSPEALEEWQRDMEHYVQESQVRAGLAAQYASEGIDPINAYPRRLSACNSLPGASTTPCPFRDFCRLTPSDRQGFLESNFRQEPWNCLSPKGVVVAGDDE